MMAIDYFAGCTTSYSICCTLPPPDYNELCGKDKQKFGFLVNQLRKQGKSLKEAQKIAHQRVTCDSIPFETIWR